MTAGGEVLLADVKLHIDRARLRAASSLNQATVRLYGEIGRLIVERQEKGRRGEHFIDRLARDLRRAYPEARGFSRRNLFGMRALYLAWREDPGCADASAQLPWSHNLLILKEIEKGPAKLWYLREAARHGWSVRVLRHQIDTRLYERQALAPKTHDFHRTLPPPQSDLAADLLKEPFRFDFLGLGARLRERNLERALVTRLQEFLLELGLGFALLGRQYRLEVGGKDYVLDLLFYHLRLRCFVAVELKTGAFEPAAAGQMNFYLSAVDDLLRHPDDRPSIGIILCRDKDRTTVEYALRDTAKPIGVAAWTLRPSLPEELRAALPSPDALLAELEKGERP